jgi:hypothetical protein
VENRAKQGVMSDKGVTDVVYWFVGEKPCKSKNKKVMLQSFEFENFSGV